jgi:hypothetical protein
MASKTLTLQAPDADEAKYRAAIDEGIAEIDRILKSMKRKQADIDRLKARTRAKLDALKASR